MLQLWTHNKENLFIMIEMDLCAFFFLQIRFTIFWRPRKWNVYLVLRDKVWQLTVCFGRPHLVIIHVHNVLELQRQLWRSSALSGHGGGEEARKCAMLLLNLINTIKWEKVLKWHSAYFDLSLHAATWPCPTDLMQRAAMLRLSMVSVVVMGVFIK